jgi:hypothetical protein
MTSGARREGIFGKRKGRGAVGPEMGKEGGEEKEKVFFF